MRRLFTACGLLVPLSFLHTASIATGPISVSEIKSNTPIPRVSGTSAQDEATKLVGFSRSTTSVTLIEYVDEAVLGPGPAGRGWLVRGNVQISKNNESQEFGVNVIIDATSGRLLAVYTDAGSNWEAPVYPEDSLERLTSEAGWRMGAELPDNMQSTAADVFATIWRDFGVKPADVGQVIVRPRWITPQYPAKKVGDAFVPLRPTEKVWIVQVCGVKMEENADGYFTQRFIQFLDGSLQFAWSFFLP